MNDLGFNQSMLIKGEAERVIRQVEGLVEAYTEVVFVMLIIVVAAIVWLAISEARRPQTAIGARQQRSPQAGPASYEPRCEGLQISRNSTY
jgi:hypothetical protein